VKKCHEDLAATGRHEPLWKVLIPGIQLLDPIFLSDDLDKLI
jgi:hypothetical protein